MKAARYANGTSHSRCLGALRRRHHQEARRQARQHHPRLRLDTDSALHTHLFTATDKPLHRTIPTYKEYAATRHDRSTRCARPARRRVRDRPHAHRRRGDGAVLIFYCNPTTRPRPTSARARRATSSRASTRAPETAILVDEAYYDYVTDPDHDTHIPLAVDNPRVIVARTFSKAYGMAGLRMGYAVGHVETIKKMREWDAGVGTSSLNVLAMQAGLAAIKQDASFIAAERARNKDVRDFTMKWFADRGMKPTDSQANFMFVNIGRPVKEFREACRAKA